MNSNYLYDYTNLLERVLSFGYKEQYSTSLIERSISYSSFFQKIEKDQTGFAPIISDEKLVKEIYSTQDVDLSSLPIYNQCLWASESYLRIQEKTHLTFECIFIYLPLNKMYECFDLYHEMDFSQIVLEFQKLYKKESIISILLNRFNYSLASLSEKTGVSYETLYSLKSRRRDIAKASFEVVEKLAKAFNVRLETISESGI